MSNRFSTSRASRSRDSSAVSSSSAWSWVDHWMSLLRRLVTAAFADARGLRRSCPTAASSAIRIRSPSAMGRAAAAASLSRNRSRITAAWAAKAPTTRWSSARSDRPRSPSIRVSPAGTWVSASCGRSHGSVPALATTVHSSAGPREVPGPGADWRVRSSSVTELRGKASRTRSSKAGSAVSPRSTLPASVASISASAVAREAFALSSVTLLERTLQSAPGPGTSRGPADEWTVVASAGTDPCERPQDADTQVPAGDTLMLGLRGRSLRAEDQRVVGAFAAQAAVILERHRLTEAAAAALPIAEGDRMRIALLAAVGHDLRSPLASAKAAVTSLRSSDIQWSLKDHAELLLTADESLDRLARLVENLLDMSRLQAGALAVVRRPVALDEVVPLALDDLGPAGRGVPDSVPDPGLLERVI